MTQVSIPSEVIWSYAASGGVLALGLVVLLRRGGWREAHGLEKLILLGPLFYAAPLSAFGIEHFTRTQAIASLVPAYLPWHLFWAYFVGACFVAAPLSLVTRIHVRLSASLLALTFFLFVVLMDAPAWIHRLDDRFALALMLRQLAFSGGALALAATLTEPGRRRDMLATIARYAVAVTALYYSLEQFAHADYVPGVPLRRLTPAYVFGHAIWTYVAAVGYAVTGVLLVAGKKTRTAAAWLGATVLLVELMVYVPIGIVERASLNHGLNYVGDTLMFCGAVLLLAGAMPRETSTGSARAAAPVASGSMRQLTSDERR
jgi:uncharacterized membrane protein YphA (DoxX/SURF4 family)